MVGILFQAVMYRDSSCCLIRMAVCSMFFLCFCILFSHIDPFFWLLGLPHRAVCFVPSISSKKHFPPTFEFTLVTMTHFVFILAGFIHCLSLQMVKKTLLLALRFQGAVRRKRDTKSLALHALNTHTQSVLSPCFLSLL